ncbi:carph-isopro domain-containing protein [Sphingobium sp. WCS2017Hpa-17]|uniref:carph-isopro domain-containing protein n=1 Tax=Sphingobium sp. WCS2017Hpa-17 TaxID=3073638 RepID=UPI0028895755|nr:hypothetical protein [Sphingobium sp. WCS2017Hpa-17]
MKQGETLFGIWGGIRKMARDLQRPASTVHGWKKDARIPSNEQPHVLEVGLSLGLPITTEHLVFPLGRQAPSDFDLAANPVVVSCDRKAETQRKDII